MVGTKNKNDSVSLRGLVVTDYMLGLNQHGEFEFDFTVGSRFYPEYPIRLRAEAYYQLKKTVGVQSSSVHNFDITRPAYRNSKMSLGIDTDTY